MGRCALIQHMLSQGAQPWHRNPQWPKSPLLPHYDVTDGISTTRSWWHRGPIPFPRRATWAGRRQPHTVLLSPPPKPTRTQHPCGHSTMFLFAQKYKTPVSTYTDSYRPPCTLKKSIHEKAPLQLWKENKFVTQVNTSGFLPQQGGGEWGHLAFCNRGGSCSLVSKVSDTSQPVLAGFLSPGLGVCLWGCTPGWLWARRAQPQSSSWEPCVPAGPRELLSTAKPLPALLQDRSLSRGLATAGSMCAMALQLSPHSPTSRQALTRRTPHLFQPN